VVTSSSAEATTIAWVGGRKAVHRPQVTAPQADDPMSNAPVMPDNVVRFHRGEVLQTSKRRGTRQSGNVKAITLGTSRCDCGLLVARRPLPTGQ
jgi:hypothetical protein